MFDIVYTYEVTKIELLSILVIFVSLVGTGIYYLIQRIRSRNK